MKIVDNRVKEEKTALEAGEIVKGTYSGDYYMILEGLEKALNLKDLRLHTLCHLTFNRIGIMRENITITFEGTK